MPSRKVLYSSLLALSLVGGGVAAGWYAEYNNERIRSYPERYCYETFSGPVNAALYITTLRDSADFLHYYRTLEAGRTPVGNFPLNGLDPNSPVYVQGYASPDSTLVEVVNYSSNHTKSRPDMVRCYVYAHTLHNKLPPDQHVER